MNRRLRAIEKHLSDALWNLNAARRWVNAFDVGDGGMDVALAYGHEAIKHTCRTAILAARLDAEGKPTESTGENPAQSGETSRGH